MHVQQIFTNVPPRHVWFHLISGKLPIAIDKDIVAKLKNPRKQLKDKNAAAPVFFPDYTHFFYNHTDASMVPCKLIVNYLFL